MRIQSFRIRKHRNIEDSGEVNLLDNLTCIVGKNQSGKTALLMALHKFNPYSPNPYSIKREWPRGQRNTRNEKQVVCEVTFELDPHETSQLAEIVAKPLTSRRVRITKDYAGHFEVGIPEQPDIFPETIHPTAMTKATDALPKPEAGVGAGFAKAAEACVAEAQRLAREGRLAELKKLPTLSNEKLRAAHSPDGSPQRAEENNFASVHVTALNKIASDLAGERTIHHNAQEFLVSRIPKFIYMADYKTFSGTAQLDEVLKKVEAKRELTEADETFLMILKLAALDLKALVTQGATKDPVVINERQLDLDDGGKTLTSRVAGRWGQNDYRIEFRADDQVFFTNIEETRKDIGMIPLDEQSKGFQWFFSFDLHFMHDSDGSFEGCVLLLDEPGLHLHPGGQEDLLKRLDAYSEKNVTIYTTHLPFLVDLREPSRIKVIMQKDDTASVADDLGASQKEEKLTLQAALGMKAHQSYLVSQKNLVVEGVDDYWILSELSGALIRSGEEGLPDDVMVSAAGSASDVVHLSTFMVGQNLTVLGFFDSDGAGRREEERLRTKWLTRYKDSKSTTMLLGDALGEKGDLTIEDLFPSDYYLKKAIESHEAKLRSVGKTGADVKLAGAGPLLVRVETAFAPTGVPFNKESAAKLIRRELARAAINKFPGDIVDKARKIFKAMRKFFDKSP